LVPQCAHQPLAQASPLEGRGHWYSSSPPRSPIARRKPQQRGGVHGSRQKHITGPHRRRRGSGKRIVIGNPHQSRFPPRARTVLTFGTTTTEHSASGALSDLQRPTGADIGRRAVMALARCWAAVPRGGCARSPRERYRSVRLATWGTKLSQYSGLEKRGSKRWRPATTGARCSGCPRGGDFQVRDGGTFGGPRPSPPNQQRGGNRADGRTNGWRRSHCRGRWWCGSAPADPSPQGCRVAVVITHRGVLMLPQPATPAAERGTGWAGGGWRSPAGPGKPLMGSRSGSWGGFLMQRVEARWRIAWLFA